MDRSEHRQLRDELREAQAQEPACSARQRDEQALRESEERFRTLVRFSCDVYWETDAQHRFTRQESADGLANTPARGAEIGKTRAMPASPRRSTSRGARASRCSGPLPKPEPSIPCGSN